MSENQIKLRRNILEFWKQIKILKKNIKTMNENKTRRWLQTGPHEEWKRLGKNPTFFKCLYGTSVERGNRFVALLELLDTCKFYLCVLQIFQMSWLANCMLLRVLFHLDFYNAEYASTSVIHSRLSAVQAGKKSSGIMKNWK